MLVELTIKLLDRLKSSAGRVVRLDHAFTAYAGDVVRRLCCDEKDDLLDRPDFSAYWYVVQYFKWFRSCP